MMLSTLTRLSCALSGSDNAAPFRNSANKLLIDCVDREILLLILAAGSWASDLHKTVTPLRVHTHWHAYRIV